MASSFSLFTTENVTKEKTNDKVDLAIVQEELSRKAECIKRIRKFLELEDLDGKQYYSIREWLTPDILDYKSKQMGFNLVHAIVLALKDYNIKNSIVAEIFGDAYQIFKGI